MKRILSIFGFLLMVLSSNAQENPKRNVLAVESNFIISTHLSYDRVITSFNDKVSLAIGADYIMGTGFGCGSHWVAPEINLFSFGPRHFLETGILYSISIYNSDNEGDSDNSLGIRVAYRYQAPKGFLFRASLLALFATDPPVFPTIGIGYSF